MVCRILHTSLPKHQRFSLINSFKATLAMRQMCSASMFFIFYAYICFSDTKLFGWKHFTGLVNDFGNAARQNFKSQKNVKK